LPSLPCPSLSRALHASAAEKFTYESVSIARPSAAFVIPSLRERAARRERRRRRQSLESRPVATPKSPERIDPFRDVAASRDARVPPRARDATREYPFDAHRALRAPNRARVARARRSRARFRRARVPSFDGNAPRDARATSATRARAADRDEAYFTRRAFSLERARERGRGRTATKSVDGRVCGRVSGTLREPICGCQSGASRGTRERRRRASTRRTIDRRDDAREKWK